MKKSFISILILSSLIFSVSAQSNKIKFIKGNLNDKTQAVRQAEGEEAVWLSNKTLEFALENVGDLGNDRDLEGLVVAGVLSISPESVSKYTTEQKDYLSFQLINVFNAFDNSNTVLISIISKFLALKSEIPTEEFTFLLNNYLKTTDAKNADSSVMKAVLNASTVLGNNNTFVILFNLKSKADYSPFKNEIDTAITELIPVSINETLEIINNGNSDQIKEISSLLYENSKISKNNLCEIAENVLNKSILLIGDSSKVDPALIDVQLKSLSVLNDNKWTRSSSIGLNYFNTAKKLYENNQMNEKQFSQVITSLSNVAPIDSISALIAYLEELNSQKENGSDVNSDVVLSVIKTLGAIGDKTAFDTLLAVTYITNYPENVLSAARDALAGLRW